MFSDLTDTELASLYCRINSGRNRSWNATGSDENNGRYLVTVEASEILDDIHRENQNR